MPRVGERGSVRIARMIQSRSFESLDDLIAEKSIAPMTGLFDHKGVLGWPAGPLSCARRLPSN